jgi:hypothetical protein
MWEFCRGEWHAVPDPFPGPKDESVEQRLDRHGYRARQQLGEREGVSMAIWEWVGAEPPAGPEFVALYRSAHRTDAVLLPDLPSLLQFLRFSRGGVAPTRVATILSGLEHTIAPKATNSEEEQD